MEAVKHLGLIGILILLIQNLAAQPGKTLDDYLNLAHQNNPAIKENNNLQKIGLLQNQLIKAQYQKPQVNFTTDYLFSPFFRSNGHAIDVTSTPGAKAYGYDVGLTNGGLYAAMVNVSAQLFNGKTVKALQNQNVLVNQSLSIYSQQILHDLDKNVTDQYITVYQIQLQIDYLQKIISLIGDRKRIISALVEKGLMQQNDYLLLEIETNNRQYDLQAQHVALITAVGQLNSLCGVSDTGTYLFTAPLISQKLPVSEFTYQKKFVADSMSVTSQQKVFNTKYIPQLSVFGNAGLNSADAVNILRNFGLSAGLHLNVPIYDGGQKKTFSQQNQLLVQNLQQYRDFNSTVLINTRTSIQQQIAATEQSITLLENQLKNQETLFQIIKDKLVLGQVSAMDYVNSIQDYAVANQNKIQAQTSLWLLVNQYNYINW